MTNRTDALRPIQQAFLRAFTGSNRTALAEQAFIAGWNAAKRSDQAIYDSIAARYIRDTSGAKVYTACPLCDARPGEEHAPACPRHQSDPMGVRRTPPLDECCPRCLRDGWVERESECKKHGAQETTK